MTATVAELLSLQFKFHPLAVECGRALRRSAPACDDYDDFIYLVARGADPDEKRQRRGALLLDGPLRGDRAPGRLPGDRRSARTPAEGASPRKTSPRPSWSSSTSSLNALVDTFFPFLSAFDDRIDSFEDDILKTPTEAQLGELFAMKRQLMEMRKVVAPQRDMMATSMPAWPRSRV